MQLSVLVHFVFLTSSFFADQDSVRLLAVEGCAALGKLLEPQDCVLHILPVIVNFSQVYFCSIYCFHCLKCMPGKFVSTIIYVEIYLH